MKGILIKVFDTWISFWRLSDMVEKEDVTEAIRLVEMSKQSLQHVEENMQRSVVIVIQIYILGTLGLVTWFQRS